MKKFMRVVECGVIAGALTLALALATVALYEAAKHIYTDWRGCVCQN